MSCLVTCVQCQQIPLDILQCVYCEAVICKGCKVKMLEEQELYGSELCCPQCLENPRLQLVGLQNGFVKQKLKKIFETHSCTLQDKEGTQYNIYDLKRHLKHHCVKNRSCQSCKTEFESMQEFQDHLRYWCQSVEITCSDCDEVFTRKEFRKTTHLCYKEVRLKMDRIQYEMRQAGPTQRPEIVLAQLRLENKDLGDQIKRLQNMLNEPGRRKELSGEAEKGERKSELQKSKPDFTVRNSY